MKVYYHKNGRFNRATGASIFAQSDGADILSVKIDWPQDSVVVAKFLLPYPEDSEQYGQYAAESLRLSFVPDAEDGGFMWTTAEGIPGGYLENSGTAYLSVQITTQDLRTIIKTTEQIEFIIGESGDYVASVVLPEMTDQILKHLATLDTYKVDRFDANKMTPPFQADGKKPANSFIYDTVYNVVDSMDYLGKKIYAQRKGAILIQSNYSNIQGTLSGQFNEGDTCEQTEVFFSNGRTWQRLIEFIFTSGKWEVSTLDEFVEIGVAAALNFVKSLEDDVQTALEQSTFAKEQSLQAMTTAQEAYNLAAQAQMQEKGIGTMQTTTDPSNSANNQIFINELNDFVLNKTGDAPQLGYVVIAVEIITGQTDKNWKCSYGVSGWFWYEIPAVQLANNIEAGIIFGDMDTTVGKHLLIDIAQGEIKHIYVLNTLGNYIDITDYVNDLQNQITVNLTNLTASINNIINGNTAVGNSLRLNGKIESALNVANAVQATQDSDGHIINQFYLPRNQGLTKVQADARYLSKQFGIPYFIANGYLSTSVPTTPENEVQYEITSSQAGVPITIFNIEQPLEYQIELTNANAFETILQLALDRDVNGVVPQMNIYVKALSNNDSDFTFISTASLDPQVLLADTITPINLKAYFNYIAQGNVIRLMPGDLLKVELLLTYPDSTQTTASIYSGQNYVSSFTMTNIQTIIVSQGNTGAYSQEISQATWALSEDEQYAITIAQTEHKLDPSVNYIVDVAMQADIGMQQVLVPRFINTNGDVTIFTDTPFNGTITIAGGVFKQPSGSVYDSNQIGIKDPSTESVDGNAVDQQEANQQATALSNTLKTDFIARQDVGELKINANATSQQLITVNTDYKLIAFNNSGFQRGNAQNDIANKRITSLKAGTYKITFFGAFSVNKPCNLKLTVFINNTASSLTSDGISLNVANNPETIGCIGTLVLPNDNSFVEVFAQSNVANINLLASQGCLLIERIM